MTHSVNGLSKKITVLASTTNGTAYNVLPIPPCMKVKSVQAYHTGLGTNVTLSVGVTGSATLFVNGAAAATAGVVAMTDTIAGGVGNVSDSARMLTVTIGGADTEASENSVDVYVTLFPDYS